MQAICRVLCITTGFWALCAFTSPTPATIPECHHGNFTLKTLVPSAKEGRPSPALTPSYVLLEDGKPIAVIAQPAPEAGQ
jgi:hypothetical protein